MMTLSTKNLMIAGGCSFSHNYITNANITKPLLWRYDQNTKNFIHQPWIKQEPFKVWSEIVAEKFDYDLINTSHTGYGNDFIFHNILDQIFTYKKQIKLIVVMWTNWLRKDIQIRKNEWHTSNLSPKSDHFSIDYFSSLYGIGGLNGPACVDYFFRYSLALSQICSSFQIPLVQCQGTTIIGDLIHNAGFRDLYEKNRLDKYKYSRYIIDWSRKDIVKYFINHNSYNDLERTGTFIGWPLFHEIGGKTFRDIMDRDKQKFYLHEHDPHPNKLAHQMYAQTIIDKINE